MYTWNFFYCEKTFDLADLDRKCTDNLFYSEAVYSAYGLIYMGIDIHPKFPRKTRCRLTKPNTD